MLVALQTLPTLDPITTKNPAGGSSRRSRLFQNISLDSVDKLRTTLPTAAGSAISLLAGSRKYREEEVGEWKAMKFPQEWFGSSCRSSSASDELWVSSQIKRVKIFNLLLMWELCHNTTGLVHRRANYCTSPPRDRAHVTWTRLPWKTDPLRWGTDTFLENRCWWWFSLLLLLCLPLLERSWNKK